MFLPGESHGQRSLAGHSPLGCKESNTTEWLKPLHYDKPITNIILDEKLKIFPLRSGRQQDYPISPILVNIVLEVLEIEGTQIEKRQTKLSLFTDDMILYNILKMLPEIY